ncbi:hypothetical protein ACIREO_35815 [Streptomyces sp. NPDC102441]|uniref:hypothetical protein n=1 Tax=Streptomyces sp. NPDC102441 TaxID=3366176 RepID=UPI00381366A3
MSYPNQSGPGFEIYAGPPAPSTARELVADLGPEAVRDALPHREQRAFDQANPYRRIERANERLSAGMEELNAFQQDLQQHITAQEYSPEQAQFVIAQTADVRQPLEDEVRESRRRADEALSTYQQRLITHIDSRRLVQTVADRTGRYSTPERATAAAAALAPPGSDRRGRGGDGRDQGGGLPPLQQSRGDRRQGPRR